MSEFLTRRDGYWHFARRVPIEFAALDPRGIVKQSTKVRISDDRNGVKAGAVARNLNAVLETYWKGLIDGQSEVAQKRYDQARKTAGAMGLQYLPAAEIAQQGIAEVVGRLERLLTERATTDAPAAQVARAAVLGGEEAPRIKLSGLFEVFEGQVLAEQTDMSPDQKRKWRNPKLRAIANLIEVVTDKDIASLTPNDALDFSEWWQARIIDEGLQPDTANKDMGHIASMIFTVNKRKRLGIVGNVFNGMRIDSGGENTRPPFATDYIQTVLLAPDALMALNDEARRVLFLMVETGIRPSEAVNLNRATINLTANIPFVSVLPDGRRLKTGQSRRELPLVGVALDAMREQPDGFPRYHDASAGLSATINKFLTENQMRQGGDRTLYSLRHSFKDRLTNTGAEDSMIDALMGHKEAGSKYGTGADLSMKLQALQRIALIAPPHV